MGDAVARFVLTLGRWFRLQEKYTERLNSDLAKIRDVTPHLSLNEWPAAWAEGMYNDSAVDGRSDLLNLDRRLLKTDDGGRIESCDLLHVDGYVIHVKRYNGSQTLSHLFSQGAVSADLLNADALYKSEFVETVRSMDPAFEGMALDAPRIVTYGIGLDDERHLPRGLPTFSKVNLRDFAQRLRRARVEPTLARIKIT